MIYVVGIGPGSLEAMTQEAVEAISASGVVVGYKTYIQLVQPLLEGKRIVENGMRGEIERCKEAIRLSGEGETVAVISSGDAGVYGMAGLIYELSGGGDAVRIVPGVTASCAAAAILGAPLMHDFCHISLSDLLTPLEVIMKRVRYAAEGDFVICFYNPKSHGRPDYLRQAVDIIRSVQGDDLVVGIVTDAGRAGESKTVTTLDAVPYDAVGMTSMVIVGNRSTRRLGELMVTPRGYAL